MEKQPAKINYFFKQGYVEFWNVIKGIFRRCGEVVSDCWDNVRDHAGDFWDSITDSITDNFFSICGHLFMMIFNLCKVIFNILFTLPICVSLSIFQGIFLLVFMTMFYIAFIIVFMTDFIYRHIKKISTSCPNCQAKFDLPAYVCTCGDKHTRLVPSKYGVLTRKCNCGQKLNTTFFNGRHKQGGKWVCPKCGYVLGSPLHVDIPIPVVGGPSSGKTCYINMAIAEIEKKAGSLGLNFSYCPNNALGDDYEYNKVNMRSGRLPEKTNDTRLKYYQFYLTPQKEKVRNLISICDVAGEAYEHSADIGRQIGFKYANAFLITVDPLSVRKYRDEISSKINLSKYGASERGMDEVLDVLIETLRNMNCLTSKNMIKTDVAVVFTKCDIPGLNEIIGAEAVRRYMQLHNIRSKFEATNKVCEQFLIQYDEQNFLNNLKAKFKSIQFFTCSSLGHVENGKQFIPENVEEPALWLIDKVSASIDLNSKWGRTI